VADKIKNTLMIKNDDCLVTRRRKEFYYNWNGRKNLKKRKEKKTFVLNKKERKV